MDHSPEPSPEDSRPQIVEGPLGLELRAADDRPGQGVRATPFLALERSDHERAVHPLRRILDGTSGPVVDATAGFAGDAGMMAVMGRSVLLLERNLGMYQLLCDALARASTEEELALAHRMTCVHGDATTILPDLPSEFLRPAVVVLDPMFPPRRKRSALPPKPMQRLRGFTGHDHLEDIEALLRAALSADPARIVLKRPPESEVDPAILGPATFAIETKLIRWDVWERSR